MREKVRRLISRFESAKNVGEIDDMFSIIKRLGYKRDCPSETIRAFEHDIRKTIRERMSDSEHV